MKKSCLCLAAFFPVTVPDQKILAGWHASFKCEFCGELMMEFSWSYIKGVPVIVLNRNDGSLLYEEPEAFAVKILSLIKKDDKKVAFDLRNSSYINSFGLGELINLRNFFLQKGIATLLIAESKKINKLFEMVGIADLFLIVKSENEL